jgi:hypothetical protein
MFVRDACFTAAALPLVKLIPPRASVPMLAL